MAAPVGPAAYRDALANADAADAPIIASLADAALSAGVHVGAAGAAPPPPPAGGPVALVTGGTSGIGAATVAEFAEHGWRVAFTGRRVDEGAALAAATGALFVRADHVVADDCARAVDATLAAFGRIDALFNNAGVVVLGAVGDTTDAELEAVLALNVVAVFRMCRLVLPVMVRQRGGAIVNCASDWALVGGRGAAAYCASKGAVVAMTRALALDAAPDGVRVLAVCPGDTFVARWATHGYGAAGGAPVTPADALASAEAPLGRVAHPREVARVVVFLAGPGASFMTGCAVPVDGGNTAQ